MINNHPQDSKVTHLLWTSGWDSTFRLLQLVVENGQTVQPVYIIDTARASTITEIQSMDKIRKLTAKLFPDTANLILPTYFFSIHEIAVDLEITDKFKALKQKSHLGSQYDWLSRFAKQHDIDDLELSIHVDDKAYGFIKDAVVKYDVDEKVNFGLDPDIDKQAPLSLFGRFRFPLLDWSKVQMKEHAIKIGTFEIMNLTWFCFNPKKGKPCGTCNPCVYSIEEGMEFRFPKEALLRYRLRPAFKMLRKVKHLLRS